MKRVVFSCFAFLWCMIGGVSAQNDTLGCNAQASYTYSGDPATGMTFNAQYSGVNNPQILWYVDGNMEGTGSTFTENVASGSEVCVIVTGFATYYDSLQQSTYTDSCMASYCEVIGETDTSGTGGCNAQAYYTYSTTPANGGTVFTAQYSGVNNPQIVWYVNGSLVGSGATYSANVPSGTEVCVAVTGYNSYYDSLQQITVVDTCEALYCEVIYSDSSGNGGCNAQAYYTYSTDPMNGGTVFTAQYSGVNNPQIVWYVNGSQAGSGATYSANVPSGTEVCVAVTGYNSYYDSLQQITVVDTCEAWYCEVIYSDSSGNGGCNAQAYYTYSTDPMNGGTVFTAQYSGVNNPQIVWYVNGSQTGSGATYSANVPSGTEVCVAVTGYTMYYDSLQQITVVDTCEAWYCEVIFSDSSDTNDCGMQVSYDYSTTPATGTTFTAQFTNANNPSVQWFVGGSPAGFGNSYTGFVTAGTQVCVVVSNYTVYYDSLQQITDVDTCEASYCEVFQVASLDESQLVEITAYPNPATDVVSLKMGNDVQVSRVVIVDLYGREALVSDQTNQIDISGLKKGLYYIRTLDASGTVTWSDQLIKN